MKTILSRFVCALEAFKANEHVGNLKSQIDKLLTPPLRFDHPLNYEIVTVPQNDIFFSRAFQTNVPEDVAKSEICGALSQILAKRIEEHADFEITRVSQSAYLLRGACKVAILGPNNRRKS